MDAYRSSAFSLPPRSSRTETAPPRPAIDRAVLDELNVMLGGEDAPAFLRELVTEFFRDALGLIDEMRQATAAGDASAFGRAAHTLKSSSAMFGATAFAAVCQEAETLSAGNLTDEAVEKFSWIETNYPQVRRELEAHIG